MNLLQVYNLWVVLEGAPIIQSLHDKMQFLFIKSRQKTLCLSISSRVAATSSLWWPLLSFSFYADNLFQWVSRFMYMLFQWVFQFMYTLSQWVFPFMHAPCFNVHNLSKTSKHAPILYAVEAGWMCKCSDTSMKTSDYLLNMTTKQLKQKSIFMPLFAHPNNTIWPASVFQ
jgi:hypothetical protein